MDRVNVSDLPSGRKMKKSMYSRTGRLLLAEGQSLTRSMKASLEASGTQHVYLGEWNPLTVARFETNCFDYRQLGVGLLKRLEQDIEAELHDLPAEFQPTGTPLSSAMLASYKRTRSRAELATAEREYEEAMAHAGQALGGGLEESQLTPVAERVALKVMRQLKNDLALLLSLASRKIAGSYFEQHSLNTVALSMSIAAAIGYSEEQVMQLGVGALFTDIGMRNAPRELITANRRLTPAEHVDIQKHTIAGLNSLQNVPGLPAVARFMVYQHHERVDGKGYPRGRKKARIQPFSRIVAVADAYDSLISPRPWRPALHPYRAIETLLHGSEKSYDNAALRGLLQYLSLFPVGSHMKLATGDTVQVIGANPGHFHHPIILVVEPVAGSGLERHQIIDLLEEPQIKIAAPCDPPASQADTEEEPRPIPNFSLLPAPAPAT